MAKFKVTKPGGGSFEIEGERFLHDGMGQRILDADGDVVYSTQSNVEIVNLDLQSNVVTAEAAADLPAVESQTVAAKKKTK